MENLNLRDELKRLEEQIKTATSLTDLKPIYFRLSEIINHHAGDFDIWVAGNDLKQLLVARGNLIQQGEILERPAAATPPPSAPTPMGTGPAAPPSSAIFEPPETREAPVPPPPPSKPTGSASGPAGPLLWDAPPPASPPSSGKLDTVVLPPRPSSVSPEPPLLSTQLLDFSTAAAPPKLPPPPAATPRPPAAVPPRPPAARPAASKLNPLLILGFIGATLLALFGALFTARQIRKPRPARTAAAVQVDVSTTPPGAAVKFSGGGKESGCTANCKLALAPGTYQVSASLDGYTPAAQTISVAAMRPAGVSLTLQPQAASMRLLTDLPSGTAEVDNQPAAPLQDGQLVLDQLAPGPHGVKVKGPNGDPSVSFNFEIADGKQPVITAPVIAHNMLALVVASFRNQAHLVASGGPWKLAVNGQPQLDAGPTGTDLTSFQPGVNEIVLGDGKDQRTLSDNFVAAPALTAFLKTDVNAGTLIVSTGQDGVHVFVNDKQFRSPTQRGQVRIPVLGKVTVRVAKNGFLDTPPQTVEVKKGAEVRVQFDLKPQPQLGSLGVHGAAPGTEIWIDDNRVGAAEPDGSFIFSQVPPGEHTIELRREQFLPKRLPRTFVAGREIEIEGRDVVLTSANGTIHFTRNPASATITFRRGDETELHEATGNQLELPPGSYSFTAASPGFTPSVARLQLSAGENRELDFTLVRERPTAPPPPMPKGMTEFADAQSWTRDGESWVHKGGGFVPYKLPPKGVFTFTVQLLKGGGVFRSGAVRWCVEFVDAKNYLLSELDHKNFWSGVIQKGERYERVKVPHNLGNQKAYTIQISVEPDKLVQSVLVGNQWKTLDSFSEPGRDFTQGKFAFLIPGNDEIAISDFKFMPK